MIENKLPKQAVNELHRKIGRNILLYQKIELVLKYFISKNNISGKVNELSSIFQKRLEINGKKTLGGLTTSFVNDFYRDDHDCDENFDDIHPSLSLNISIGSENIEETEENLKDIVSARNFIVHNILEKFKFETAEQCGEIEAYLDIKYDKAKKFLEDLKRINDLIRESSKYILSDEYIGRIQKFSNADEISRNMASEMIQGVKRDDGWIVLSKASNILREKHPELFVDMKKYGHNSLKKVMESSNLFEFYGEETLKGGKRDLFRLK